MPPGHSLKVTHCNTYFCSSCDNHFITVYMSGWQNFTADVQTHSIVTSCKKIEFLGLLNENDYFFTCRDVSKNTKARGGSQ